MPDMGFLEVSPDLRVPLAELEFRASRSGGPGGQHVNTSSTRVEVTWDVAGSPALSEEQRQRLLVRLASRLDGTGRIRLVSSSTRSQLRNREDVTERLREVVAQALVVPKARKRTRTPRAAKAARLENKRRRAATKRDRRPPRGKNDAARLTGLSSGVPPIRLLRYPLRLTNRASRRCPSPIQTPVLNGLAHVAGRQLIGAREVGDRAGDLEHPVVCPRREAQAGHGLPEQTLDWLR